MFTFKTKPFPHQLDAFNKFKEAQIFALLADMGVGKSKVVIDVLTYRFLVKQDLNRILIVAPTLVHTQWIEEQFTEHCAADCKGFVYRATPALGFNNALQGFIHNQSPALHVLAVNTETFQSPAGLKLAKAFFKSSPKIPAIVVDEASRIKNPDAKCTKNLCKLRKEFPQSLRIAVTGTPAAKSPLDMWSIFDFLRSGFMGCTWTAFKRMHQVLTTRTFEVKDRKISVEKLIDFATWKEIKRYIAKNVTDGEDIPLLLIANICKKFGMTSGDAMLIAKTKDFVCVKNTEALQARIAPVTFSISKADCLNLPPKIYKKRVFKMTPQQRALMEQLREYAVGQYKGATLTLSSKAQLGLRVLQICGGFFSHHGEEDGVFDVMPIDGGNPKLKSILSDIDEIGEQQFIVWAVFRPELQLLDKELSKVVSLGRIDGEDVSDRSELVTDFKKGHIQCLVCHPQSGGYGLNLQNAGLQYWYSRNYRTETRLQAEDRSHRHGITKSPMYIDLIMDSPFEHAVLASNQQGKDINALFVNTNLNDLF